VKKDDSLYICHIRDAITQIKEYVAGMDENAFAESRLVQDAVIRQFEIIGDATKHISGDFRSRHAGIPWKDMAGMRDKLIHDYFGVDIGAIWKTVEEDLPYLEEQITSLKQ